MKVYYIKINERNVKHFIIYRLDAFVNSISLFLSASLHHGRKKNWFRQ